MGNAVAIVLVLLVCGAIGRVIGRDRGHPVAGFFLGFFLTIPGWLITAFLPRSADTEAGFQAEVARNQHAGNIAGSLTGAPPGSTATRLAHLDDLLAQGMLNEAEYAHQRQAIISDV